MITKVGMYTAEKKDKELLYMNRSSQLQVTFNQEDDRCNTGPMTAQNPHEFEAGCNTLS